MQSIQNGNGVVVIGTHPDIQAHTKRNQNNCYTDAHSHARSHPQSRSHSISYQPTSSQSRTTTRPPLTLVSTSLPTTPQHTPRRQLINYRSNVYSTQSDSHTPQQWDDAGRWIPNTAALNDTTVAVRRSSDNLPNTRMTNRQRYGDNPNNSSPRLKIIKQVTTTTYTVSESPQHSPELNNGAGNQLLLSPQHLNQRSHSSSQSQSTSRTVHNLPSHYTRRPSRHAPSTLSTSRRLVEHAAELTSDFERIMNITKSMSSEEGKRLTAMLQEIKQKREAQLQQLKQLAEVEQQQAINEALNSSLDSHPMDSPLFVGDAHSSSDHPLQMSQTTSKHSLLSQQSHPSQSPQLPNIDSLVYTPSYFNLHTAEQPTITHQLQLQQGPSTVLQMMNGVSMHSHSSIDTPEQMQQSTSAPTHSHSQHFTTAKSTATPVFKPSAQPASPHSYRHRPTRNNRYGLIDEESEEDAMQADSDFDSDSTDSAFFSPRDAPIEQEVEFEEQSFRGAIESARQAEQEFNPLNTTNSLLPLSSQPHSTPSADDSEVETPLALKVVDTPQLIGHNNNSNNERVLGMSDAQQVDVVTMAFLDLTEAQPMDQHFFYPTPNTTMRSNDENEMKQTDKSPLHIDQFDYKYDTFNPSDEEDELKDSQFNSPSMPLPPPPRVASPIRNPLSSPRHQHTNAHSTRYNQPSNEYVLLTRSKHQQSALDSTNKATVENSLISSRNQRENIQSTDKTTASHRRQNSNASSSDQRANSPATDNLKAHNSATQHTTTPAILSLTQSKDRVMMKSLTVGRHSAVRPKLTRGLSASSHQLRPVSDTPADLDQYLKVLGSGLQCYKVPLVPNAKIALRRVFLQPLTHFLHCSHSLIDLRDARLTRALQFLTQHNNAELPLRDQPFIIRWQTSKLTHKQHQFLVLSQTTRIYKGQQHGAFPSMPEDKIEEITGVFEEEALDVKGHLNSLTLDNTHCQPPDRTLDLIARTEADFELIYETIHFLQQRAHW